MLRTDKARVEAACRKGARILIGEWRKFPRKDEEQASFAFAFDKPSGGMEIVTVKIKWDDLEKASEDDLFKIMFLACYTGGKAS